MKIVLCLIAILGCAFAVPPSFQIDWSQIKPEYAFIEPINDETFPSGRVIGGNEATPNSHPGAVAVFINGASFCGGSLISQLWVLTAAHCTIRATFVELIFGAHNIRLDEPTQVSVTSTNIINHEGYIASSLTNDVALVRLPQTLALTSSIQPVTLAPASSGTFAGSSATLIGWGRISDSSTTVSPTLQEVNLSVISNIVCALTYGTIIRASTICTSGAGTVGGCNGDSGGPLFVGNVQVGVASFVSARGCESGLPTGYARVSEFASWISQNARN